MNTKHNSHLINTLTIISIVILSVLTLYLPFVLKAYQWLGTQNLDMHIVYKHFDGPLYVIAAKTFYNPALIKSLHLQLESQPGYYPAHLPLYPLLIRALSFLGYMRAMLFIPLLATIAMAIMFYVFVWKYKITERPLILTIVLLFLPRLLVVRSVGAPETLFIFFVLASIYFFESKKYLLAGLFGALSVMTKSPGILLFIAYCLCFAETYVKERKLKLEWIGVALIPLGLLLVFVFYYLQTGDFFAYFHSGDNIHLVYPYAAFDFTKRWVGTAWLEDVVFYFAMYLLTVVALYKSHQRSIFYFGLVFLTATIFVQHRDIARYSLPLWPLTLIAFPRFFTSKRFLIVFIILLPAIYLYAWNFMLYNVMPITDWTPYI